MTNAPAPSAQPPQKKSSAPVWIIAIAAALVILLIVGGVFAALAAFGVRKYIANSKKAEAYNTLGQLAKDAAEAYDRDGKLCPSASAPVPATVPHATKYQSTPGDWQADEATHAGFACLHFSMADPQYYQYDYKSTPDGFTVIARGDLDGNGVESRFKLEGRLIDGVIRVAPNIEESDPDE